MRLVSAVRNTEGVPKGQAIPDQAIASRVPVPAAVASVTEVGRLFLTDHLLAFEMTSIVLLIAAVGGVVLGMRSAAEEEDADS